MEKTKNRLVIRVSVFCDGIKNRDRKAKRYINLLEDIEVSDENVFHGITDVKTFLEENFNFELLEKYKNSFKKLNRTILEINLVEIVRENTYSIAKFEPMLAKYLRF